MPRNGSGVYSPPAASYPAVSGALIESADRNAIDADIAAAITNSIAVNGESVVTSNLPMGGFRHTGCDDGVSATDYSTLGQLNTAIGVVNASIATKAALGANNDITSLTATTAINRTGGTSITGTNTNNNASAGHVGEYIESSILVASAISLTTNVAANVTSISLTAGDWDVSGIVRIHSNSATTSFTQGVGSISLTSATLDGENQANVFSAAAVPTSGVNYCALGIPSARISLASTTTIYLVARAAFTVSTAQAYGVISARRIR